MIYTADFLITKRKEKWDANKNIELDIQFREAVAQELVENISLREEVKNKPEKLIELLFVVVDKEQKTVPFFFNNVQQDFVNKINKAKQDFAERENNIYFSTSAER